MLEVFVTVLLLSVLGLALVSGAGAGLRLVRRAFGDVLGVARVAQADRRLREAALRVRTPFWQSSPEAEEGPGRLAVPWADGEPDERLELENRDGILVVRLGDERPAAFGPFAGLGFGLYRDAAGRPAGVQVTLAAASNPGAQLVILAPFGGSPIARGGTP